MRCFYATPLLPLALSWALPVTVTSSPSSASAMLPPDHSASVSPDLALLAYNIDDAYAKFEANTGVQPGQLTTPLVFQLQVNPTQHLHQSDVLISNQPLRLNWTTSEYNSSWTVVAPIKQSLTVQDKLGFPHDLVITLGGTVADVPDSSLISFENPQTQNINIHIESVDGVPTGSSGFIGFTILTDPTAQRRLLCLVPNHVPHTIKFDQFEESFMVAQPLHHVAPSEPVGYDDDESYDVEAEIESLLLLEAQAGELHTAIAVKK